MAVVIAYVRQRFPIRVFGPAIALLAFDARWAAGPVSIDATAALAVMLIALLIALFRVWDDIEDRDRDRIAHPERVLPQSPIALFNRLRLILLGATGAALFVLGTWPSALEFAALALLAHVWYRYARMHLAEAVANYALLLKYPALVAIVAHAIAPLRPGRLALAALAAYVAACAYELLHNAGRTGLPVRPAGHRLER